MRWVVAFIIGLVAATFFLAGAMSQQPKIKRLTRENEILTGRIGIEYDRRVGRYSYLNDQIRILEEKVRLLTMRKADPPTPK